MLVRLALASLVSLAVTAPASAVPVQQMSSADPEFSASVHTISEEYRDRMIGVSWEEGCPVPIDDLRIIEMNYRGFDGTVHDGGQLMVHKDVAADVVEAFGEMYDAQFPIRRMELIEEYDGSDDASMAADNTSSFNCRPITGSPGRFSIHSYGKAIDINTIENPYVKGDLVLPPAGEEFLDRDDVRPGMITKNDPVVKAFKKRGFDWGGDWHSLKDYQHFEAKKS
ncbi:M15 family metallopeptidase [Nocardioides sp. Root151]|uniref:M15 family metallopeptidase n=1 Tax=Nocardioides sp. Root151 TaxID=1736475 RepID=UPI000702AC76|nr:M15 family metallopeptidase [Nocardioides sp. Root151]KQZ70776.1 hypothetical protein ASD66_14505 [Nocardioides sp. Root151]